MSTVRHIRTLGQPYFALVSEAVGDAGSLPAFGLGAMTLEFRVDALPVQLSSADELHPIFSFDHDSQTQPPIFEVGVTPSGRFKALALSGSTWQSAPSLAADATVWHTLQVAYDAGTGQWTVTLDGAVDTGTVDPGAQYLTPLPGYNSRLLLFNGRDGLSRGQVSVRSASATFVGAGSTTLTYTVDGTANGQLVPVASGTNPETFPTPCVLGATWYEPVVSHPWGAVPSISPNAAYAYGLDTDWTRLPQRTTAWTRVAA